MPALSPMMGVTLHKMLIKSKTRPLSGLETNKVKIEMALSDTWLCDTETRSPKVLRRDHLSSGGRLCILYSISVCTKKPGSRSFLSSSVQIAERGSKDLSMHEGINYSAQTISWIKQRINNELCEN